MINIFLFSQLNICNKIYYFKYLFFSFQNKKMNYSEIEEEDEILFEADVFLNGNIQNLKKLFIYFNRIKFR